MRERYCNNLPQVTITLLEYEKLKDDNKKLLKSLKSKKCVTSYFERTYYTYSNYYIQTESEIVIELNEKCNELLNQKRILEQKVRELEAIIQKKKSWF